MIGKKYKVIRDLGSGAYADVKLVEDVTSGIQYACKLVKTDAQGHVPEQVLIDT